ncbi:MAG: serine hydrolase [Saprospiraceae bacterium]|nr:serine hydrolase [Saprospiraceae bacterium]
MKILLFPLFSLLMQVIPFSHFMPLADSQVDTAAMNRVINRHITEHHFQGVVLVADKGEICLQRASGYRDMVLASPITSETTFSIASITKMFTAVLILQLEQEGKLSLDNNLRALVPEFKSPMMNLLPCTIYCCIFPASQTSRINFTEKPMPRSIFWQKF